MYEIVYYPNQNDFALPDENYDSAYERFKKEGLYKKIQNKSAYFKITKESLNELKNQGLEEKEIQSLETLINKKFAIKEEFEKTLDTLNLSSEQKNLIVKHANKSIEELHKQGINEDVIEFLNSFIKRERRERITKEELEKILENFNFSLEQKSSIMKHTKIQHKDAEPRMETIKKLLTELIKAKAALQEAELQNNKEQMIIEGIKLKDDNTFTIVNAFLAFCYKTDDELITNIKKGSREVRELVLSKEIKVTPYYTLDAINTEPSKKVIYDDDISNKLVFQNIAVTGFLKFLKDKVITEKTVVVHIDHWFCDAFLSYQAGKKVCDWLIGSLYYLQQQEANIMKNNPNLFIFRHFLIPHPKFIDDATLREDYRNLIILVLHTQLFLKHINFIHLVPSKILVGINADSLLQTVILPIEKIGCVAHGYYSGNYSGLEILTGTYLNDTAKKINKFLFNIKHKCYRLAYYEENYFKSKKLPKTQERWETIVKEFTEFFLDITEPDRICLRCKNPIENENDIVIDYREPESNDKFSLTNLWISHKQCKYPLKYDYSANLFIPKAKKLSEDIPIRIFNSADVRADPIWLQNDSSCRHPEHIFCKQAATFSFDL